MWNVAAYLRLSKEDSDNIDSNRIINQKELIERDISNYEDMKLVDYYIDYGYSGTNFKRPGFERLLQDIKNRKVNAIIVKDLSRFGRNHIEVDSYLENIFPAFDLRFISILEDIDSYKNPDSLDNFLVPIKNLMNDAYAKDISKKVKSTLKIKKMNGEFIGVSAPYDYIKDPKDIHKFIKDMEASYYVLLMFNGILI